MISDLAAVLPRHLETKRESNFSNQSLDRLGAAVSRPARALGGPRGGLPFPHTGNWRIV